MYRFITKEEFSIIDEHIQDNIIEYFINNNRILLGNDLNSPSFLETFPFGQIINSHYNDPIALRNKIGISHIVIGNCIYQLRTIKKIEEKIQITHKIRNYV